jgi:parallel beta-helix repeat protein
VDPSDQPDLTTFDNWCETLLDAAGETQVQPEPGDGAAETVSSERVAEPVAVAAGGGDAQSAAAAGTTPRYPMAIPVNPVLEVVCAPMTVLRVDKPARSGRRVRFTRAALILLLAAGGGAAAWWFVLRPGAWAPWKASGRTMLRVSPAGGEGSYPTIGAAVSQAAPGSCIRVAPGTYRESLVLDKEVEVIGDGPPGAVAVESTHGECVFMRTERAAVRNLVLHGRAGKQGGEHAAVRISQGTLTLEDCDISSEGLAGVAVEGAGTAPVLRRCQVHDGRQAGVLFRGKARGLLADCDIYGNAGPNVEIRDGARPVLRGCRVHDGGQTGVSFLDAAGGTIEDCSIYDNARSNVIIQGDSDPVLRSCRVQGGKDSGVFIHHGGRGTIEHCDLAASTLPAVFVQDGGRPLLRKCRIHDARDAGVFLHKGAGGTVEDCDITANKYGVALAEAANPLIRGCRIRRNESYGVYAFTTGTATVRDCDLTANEGGAAFVGGGAVVNRINNRE